MIWMICWNHSWWDQRHWAYIHSLTCLQRSTTRTLAKVTLRNASSVAPKDIVFCSSRSRGVCFDVCSVICLHISFRGRDEYKMRFPEALAFDLNQDPQHRPKRSGTTLSTLTTGCTKVWLESQHRYMTGTECLAFHSIPTTSRLATTMGSTQVRVDGISNSAKCFLAGNSMHGVSVGSLVAICLYGTSLSRETKD